MRRIENINDGWFFSKEKTDLVSGKGFEVNLPHTWNSELAGGDKTHKGVCWYGKTFEFEEEDAGKSIFLEIGAAGNVAEVFVNDEFVGENRCGYALFRFDISDFLTVGSNRITVKVDNSLFEDVYPMMADFTFYGGLYRDVNLILVDSVHYAYLDGSREGIYLKQEKLEDGNFRLKIMSNIVSEEATERRLIQKLMLMDDDGKIVASEVTRQTVKGCYTIEDEMVIEKPHLWDGVDSPYLYRLSAELFDGEKLVDQQEIPFGFRTVEADPEKGLILNGKPIKLRGVSRHQDRAYVGNAITKAHMEEDMAIIREMGANSIRLAHYQHDDYFYSLCDRYGLLVWAEIPFISVPTQADDENMNAKEQMKKLVRQAFNHPSIYCWGVQNEITIAADNERTHDLVAEMAAFTKELDDGRLTAQAHIHSVADESPLNRMTDLVGYNLYYGWYYGEVDGLGKRLDTFHNCQADKPVLVTEYGVDTNPAYHSYEPVVKDYSEEYQMRYHKSVIDTFEARDFVLGGYVWNMFDFGSEARDEGGAKGLNQKGLVSYDRTLKKDAYYLYKAYWSEESFVHIAGRRFVNRHKALNNLCILTNIPGFAVYLNDDFLVRVEKAEPVHLISDVELKPGRNEIRVVAENSTDSIVLYRVDEPDQSYVCKKDTEKANVVNWFEKFDLSHSREVVLKEGYYSTYDSIGELMGNEAAKAVFNKYFEGFSQHPKFKAMLAVMTIEKMAKISQLSIPRELLGVINGELNCIKK